MANYGEIDVANLQTNVTQVAAGKKGRNKKRNVANKIQEVSFEVMSNYRLYTKNHLALRLVRTKWRSCPMMSYSVKSGL